MLRLVPSNDIESLNEHAAYLSESLQPLPSTPFAAMIAKQIHNDAAAYKDGSSRDAFTIGVPGKASVKEVSCSNKLINAIFHSKQQNHNSTLFSI